jgi:hypothetical protein
MSKRLSWAKGEGSVSSEPPVTVTLLEELSAAKGELEDNLDELANSAVITHNNIQVDGRARWNTTIIVSSPIVLCWFLDSLLVSKGCVVRTPRPFCTMLLLRSIEV